MTFLSLLFSQIQSNKRLFADDCVLYREVAVLQDCQALQEDLDRFSHWSKTWQLTFKVSKCYHIGITCKRTPVHFDSLNGKLISRVSSTTYLGIHITDNLSWNADHCSNICQKANSTLGLLRRILSGCTAEVKSSTYLALSVRPEVEYASSV